MNANQLMESLVELRAELEISEDIDPKLLEQARRLEIEMHEMLNSNELKAEDRLSEELLALETQFAAEHPVIEKILRNIVNTLAQMGI
jgi:hypothetical protein